MQGAFWIQSVGLSSTLPAWRCGGWCGRPSLVPQPHGLALRGGQVKYRGAGTRLHPRLGREASLATPTAVFTAVWNAMRDSLSVSQKTATTPLPGAGTTALYQPTRLCPLELAVIWRLGLH